MHFWLFFIAGVALVESLGKAGGVSPDRDVSEHLAYYRKLLEEYDMSRDPDQPMQPHPTLTKKTHIIHHYLPRRDGKAMVIGHRGGYFGPENSVSTFEGAVEH